MSSSWGYMSSARARLRSYIKPEHQAQPKPSHRLLDLHGQVEETHESPGWRAWVNDKRREAFGLRTGRGNGDIDIQVVNLFPGWATRRYHREGDTLAYPPQFEVEVFVSGFACSRRDPENATRSQRALLRLAKTFAGLPKVVESTGRVAPYESSLAHLTQQTEERLAIIPQNDPETDAGLDIEALDRELMLAKQVGGEDGDISETSSSSDEPTSTSIDNEVPVPYPHILKRLHDNLEKRIRFLWYSSLPNRTIRLHFLFSSHNAAANSENHETSSDAGELSLKPEDGFLATQDVATGPDGSFQATLRVKWEDLCHHPGAQHLAFGETIEDHDLLVIAKLLPNPTPFNSPASTPHSPVPPVATPAPLLAAVTRVPITHSPVRVISDIDDTVKFSGILSGARTVFHNVFVKDLTDSVIPGMGEWYTKMFGQGVRFHYVSNGPFAVLPILNDFFQVSQLPTGSLKLKSYAGRSIFEGLLSAPATRKRSGVLEILDAFPDSLFFLIGDTGEQDLELYADIARERPNQILGVFLRDARPNSPITPEPLSDPTGSKAFDPQNTNERPPLFRTQSSSPADSLTSLLRRFPSYRTKHSIWRTASLPSLGVAKAVVTTDNTSPSRPTRFTVDGVLKSAEGHFRKRYRGPHFGFGPLSSQPEEGRNQSDSTSSSILSSPISIGQSSDQFCSSPKQSIEGHAHVSIAEQPKPTPSPSVPLTQSPTTSFALKREETSSTVFENSDGQSSGQAPTGTSRDQLQKRVHRARRLIPEHIVLRVFGDPSECVEVDEILRHEGCSTRND